VCFLELDIFMTMCHEKQIESRKIREEQNKTNSKFKSIITAMSAIEKCIEQSQIYLPK
jgi:hypothetical protein